MNLSEEISLLFKILNKNFCLTKFPVEVENISFLVCNNYHYDESPNSITRLLRNSLPKNIKPRLFVEFKLKDVKTMIPGFLTPLFYETLIDLIKCLGFFELLKSIDLNIELK
jgi:hypothetical protein